MPQLVPQLKAPRVRTPPRRGFTLVELLVTLALLGVVGTIVSRMMLDQQRFYQQTNEQMTVRRELRTAMSMIPADLRSISSVGGDIGSFDATQLTFRTTTGAAVICAKPNTTTLDVPPTNMARTTLTSWYTVPAVGDTVYAFRTDSLGAGGDSWTAHRITAVAQSTAYCAPSPYIDAVLDATKARWRFTVTPAMHDSVKVGAAVRFTRNVRYSLTVGSSGKSYLGRAEYVGGAWAAATPVAGPFTAANAGGTGGVRFVMFDSLGLVVPPGGSGTRVSRIDLTLRGQGTSSTAVGAQARIPKDSIAFRIALRNRQ